MKMSNGFVRVSLVVGICVGVITIAKVAFTINNRYIDNRIDAYIDGCGMVSKMDKLIKDVDEVKLILALVNKGNPEYENIKKLVDSE